MFKTCSRCGEEKTIEQFGFLNRSKGTRCKNCKACESTRVRAYYLAHHDEVLARQNARQRQQRAERKASQQQQQGSSTS